MQDKEIVIRIRFPRWPKRHWLIALGGGLLLLGAAGYAYTFAAFSLTNPTAGTPVSAATIAANYNAITAKVTELQGIIQKPYFTNPTTGKQYSLAATYCGVTAPTNGQFVDGANTGNVAGKSLCEKACANSATAHMCTTPEVQRFLATGGVFPGTGPIAGWYSSGTWGFDGTKTVVDCVGWTDATNTDTGPVSYLKDSAHNENCNILHPILCCD